MSYMTEILNSMSMKVSSGYETSSFRMYLKKKKHTTWCILILILSLQLHLLKY